MSELRLQVKDVPDDVFLAAIVVDAWARRVPRLGAAWQTTADRLDLPPRLVLAKAQNMIRRGLVTGCACGCRGDWLPVK